MLAYHCTFTTALYAYLRTTAHFPADSHGKSPKLTLRLPPHYRRAPRLHPGASGTYRFCPRLWRRGSSKAGPWPRLSWRAPHRKAAGNPRLFGGSLQLELGSAEWEQALSTSAERKGRELCLAKRLLLPALQLQRLLWDALASEVAICSPNFPSTRR